MEEKEGIANRRKLEKSSFNEINFYVRKRNRVIRKIT
jgi:hypothetical protein